MLEQLKLQVCEANLELVRRGLVLLTWGNASARDPESGRLVIKPSGVSYDSMFPNHMVVLDRDGNVLEGDLKPSVDTPTHLALYRAWPEVHGIVHTHSHYATCWAQACRPIPCLGTTHADFAYGDVPVTESLTPPEIADDYETHIGECILRRYNDLNPLHYPAVLAAKHGPFAWGKTVGAAVEHAVVVEELAKMALHTLALAPGQEALGQTLLDKHFLRKHGTASYYGQQDDL